MPQSAIATGAVARVLPPAELAQLLYEYLRSPLDADNFDHSRSLLIDSRKIQRIADILVSIELLINVTRFFRDPTAWTYLESMVLAPLIENNRSGEELRFWITACSTGDEAYSLGILINEIMTKYDKQFKI